MLGAWWNRQPGRDGGVEYESKCLTLGTSLQRGSQQSSSIPRDAQRIPKGAVSPEMTGARSRTRTGTALRPRDFKSPASTDFAIRAVAPMKRTRLIGQARTIKVRAGLCKEVFFTHLPG